MTTPLFREDMPSYVREDGITVVQREAFAREYFHYKPGHHVVFGGPSTHGKTTLAFDLLEYTAKPTFPAYVAVSKPRDPATASLGQKLGFRRVSEWPPPKKLNEMELFGGKKPAGYLVWPVMGDLHTDTEKCAHVTRVLLEERYSSGANPKNKGGILVMDDTMVKAKVMGLDKEMVTILAMAGAMDYGLWVFVQKATDSGRTTVWSYEMATHVFLTKGGDRRTMMRYVEIFGEHGMVAKQVLPTLKPYQFLYVNKDDGTICIVDAK